MDNYLNNKRFNSYLAVTAKWEAARLRNYADTLSGRYLKDFSTRLRFMDEMDKFIESQIKRITSSQNEKECEQCLFNLREEKKLLEKQETFLLLKSAKLVVSAELVNKLDSLGYVINGVGIFLGGFQVIAGIGITAVSFTHANVVGTIAGAALILHGLNGIEESVRNIKTGKSDNTGFLKERYMSTAEFMGFDRKIGSLAYSSTDIVLSVYGLSRIVLRPDTWRLFRHIPSDYVRSINNTSAPALMIEGIGDGLSIKSAYDSYNK